MNADKLAPNKLRQTIEIRIQTNSREDKTIFFICPFPGGITNLLGIFESVEKFRELLCIMG